MDMALTLIRSVVDGLGNFIGAVFIGIAGATVELYRRIRENSQRLDQLEEETEIENDPTRMERHESRMQSQEDTLNRIERYLVGDKDDPSSEGLLTEVHEIHDTVREQDDSDSKK